MRVLISGIDGYLGWPLAQHLVRRGHTVGGIDAFLRRRWVAEVGGESAIPIVAMDERLAALHERAGADVAFWEGDLQDYGFVEAVVREFQPEVLVHLGEMPSAPYSQIDFHHAAFTQTNNLIGTLAVLYAMQSACPEAHLVKLGTMGEYGTPNVNIPEGFFTVEYRGRTDTLPFPRQAGSWYHWSKVHDSNNIMFACRIWGLRATDIMQGVVYGTRIEEMGSDPRLATRMDFDQCFGTVVNRYCAQVVIGHPLTPYGRAGQQRGFIPLRDSIQCMRLAIEQPPAPAEYRVLNQFAEVYGVMDLARAVQAAGREVGLRVEIRPVENPRREAEDHYYQPDHERLFAMGYKPTHGLHRDLVGMLQDLLPHRQRIRQRADAVLPDIRWDGTRRRSAFLEAAAGPRDTGPPAR